MSSLRRIYDEISNSKSRWSYYANPYPDFSIKDSWLSNDSSNCFIREYFTYGGKNGLIEDLSFGDQYIHFFDRSQHIISTYLIGVFLIEKLGIHCLSAHNSKYDISPLYLWFITCLYHDVGYFVENNINVVKDQIRANGLKGFKKQYKLRYMRKDIFKIYPMDIIDLYLKHRAREYDNHCNKIDHGIAGGLFLYENLRKMFKKSYQNRTCKEDSTHNFYAEYNGRELHLSKQDYKLYSLASDSIIAHNLYAEKLNFFLDQVGAKHIKPNFKFDNNQIYYILSLADTIEPLKNKSLDSLDKIDLEYIEKDRELLITVDESMIHFEKYIMNLVGLNDWLDIKTTRLLNNKVSICIK